MTRKQIQNYDTFNFIFDMVRVATDLSDVELLHSIAFDKVEELVAEEFNAQNAYDVPYFSEWVYNLAHDLGPDIEDLDEDYDYDDYNLEDGYDPYMGDYSWDC